MCIENLSGSRTDGIAYGRVLARAAFVLATGRCIVRPSVRRGRVLFSIAVPAKQVRNQWEELAWSYLSTHQFGGSYREGLKLPWRKAKILNSPRKDVTTDLVIFPTMMRRASISEILAEADAASKLH